ncbi:MAG: MFS transporter [Dehalococcoidia bacterium]
MENESQKKPFFYGWWISIGGAVVMAMSSGINFHGFGNYFIPLGKEFGWSRTTVSAIFSFARLEAGFLGPLEGLLIDRIGPRKLMLIGIPLMGLGYVLLSRVNGLVSFLLVFVGIISLGQSMGMVVPTSAAVANWFKRKRGFAFGIMWSGVGFGGLIVPAFGWSIDEYGWRNASIIVGILVTIIGMPIATLMRHKPEPYGMLPDGDIPQDEKESDPNTIFKEDSSNDFTVKEALGTSSFWFLNISIMARTFVTGGVGLHLVPYYVGLGATAVQAAGWAGSVGLMSIPGRFGLSYLGDYINRRYVMAVALLGLTVSIYMLAVADSISEAFPAIVLYAISQGGIAVIPQALIADYFGRKAFATIAGLRSAIQMIGVIFGPIISGYVYDQTGNYKLAFIGLTACGIISFILILLAKPPVKRH